MSFLQRPALSCFIFCSAGIAAAKLSGSPTQPKLLIVCILVLILGFSSAVLRTRILTFAQLCGMGCLCLLGFLSFTSREYFFENSVINKVANARSGDAIVYGHLSTIPEIGDNFLTFYLRTDSLSLDSMVICSAEKIIVSVYGLQKADTRFIPTLGQGIKCYGELVPIQEAGNPYEFSADSRLRQTKGITAHLHLHRPYDLYITDSSVDFSPLDRSAKFFTDIFLRSRQLIGSVISDTLTRGFVNAVVLGDKSELTPVMLDDFQRAGLTHLLVVSGFNVGIVALLVYYLLRLFGISLRKLRIFLSMVAVLFYCLVVGLEPSVVRALVVIEFLFLSRFIERRPDIGNLTSAAALVTVLLQPHDLFNIGFQLSYGAVFALVFLFPRFEELFIPVILKEGKSFWERWGLRCYQGFFTSLSVFLGLLPVYLFHFHRLSLVGLAMNIIGIPIAAMITILGFLLIPITLMSETVASLYGDSLLLMTKLIRWIAHTSGNFSWSVIELPRPQTVLIILYLLVLTYIFTARSSKYFIGRVVVSFSFFLIILFAKVPFAYSLVRVPGNTSLLFFDVGQGDAMLLTSPEGKAFLVDFGGVRQDFSAIAERKIFPLLNAEGITEFEGGLITHMHIDHYGGAVAMMGKSKFRNLYTSGERTGGYAAYRLDSISQALHVPVLRLQEGSKIDLGDGLVIYALNPPAMTDEIGFPLSSEGMNHHSLALKIVYKNSSALLLGDIESSDEERMVKRYGDFLRSDVVKVAHHGSKTSSSRELVRASKAKYAIISVGRHNGFGHPSFEVLKRWYSSGATVLRTDEAGAVLLRSEGDYFRRVSWK
ncbi:MAG: DNA internalization-related competence protein ComEC/Rec2 [Ignavibacteriota bacterium]